MNDETRRVIIVLPAYNEAANLPHILAGAERVSATTQELRFEVIVVDDGSADLTAAVAREPRKVPVVLVQHPENRGLAAALRTGLLEAIGRCRAPDVVVVMDADNSHLPAQIPALVRRLDEGCDVAIASRYRRSARVSGVPRHRQLLSMGMSLLFRSIRPLRGVRDYSCGFRAYSAGILTRAYQRQDEGLFTQSGFSCMVGLLLRLAEEGAVFGEVPIDLQYDKKVGASKMRVLSTTVETLGLLAKDRLAVLRRGFGALAVVRSTPTASDASRQLVDGRFSLSTESPAAAGGEAGERAQDGDARARRIA